MGAETKAGHFFEDLTVGMEASFVRRAMEGDVNSFAQVTGDTNPVHIDEAYASNTMFGGRIVHGALTASYVSTIFGTILPGPGAIYVSQSFSFRRPVRIGDEVTATARLVELIPEKRRVVFTCDCSVDGKTVLEGEAVLMVPSRES